METETLIHAEITKSDSDVPIGYAAKTVASHDAVTVNLLHGGTIRIPTKALRLVLNTLPAIEGEPCSDE